MSRLGAPVSRTETRTFIGANIKGTPAMSSAKVRGDLATLRRRADVIALQEFRWAWYWRAIEALLGERWRSFPNFVKGLARPTKGAQGVTWKRRLFRLRDSLVILLHKGVAGISEDRYLRAVLLADRKRPWLRCWFGSTHFVVGGDSKHDSERRKAILREDLRAFDVFLGRLTATGEAVVMELDANIRRGTWAYAELLAILDKHGARIVGEHGVEYLIVIDGKHVEVVVDRAYRITPAELNTDHEARCLDHHLQASAP